MTGLTFLHMTRYNTTPAARTLAAILVAAALWCVAPASAQKNKVDLKSLYQEFTEDRYMDMEFEPNLSTPAVPEQCSAQLKTIVKQAAQRLQKSMQVDLVRSGEAFVATVPSDKLFLPNDTLLSADANGALTPLLPLMRDPMEWKVVLAVHTDDTGSPFYRENLAAQRLNSVYDWFMQRVDGGQISERQLIIPYSMGAEMPLVPNNTRTNRSINRRLEVYFVPGPTIIEAALKAARASKK